MKQRPCPDHLLAPLVRKAICGDTIAMYALMTIYTPYIQALATVPLYDAAGNTHRVLDITKCQQLESTFMETALKFVP